MALYSFWLIIVAFLYGLIMPLIVSAYVYDFSGYYEFGWLKEIISANNGAGQIENCICAVGLSVSRSTSSIRLTAGNWPCSLKSRPGQPTDSIAQLHKCFYGVLFIGVIIMRKM